MRILIFLAFTALFSAPFWWLSRMTAFDATALLMWCPGVAAMLTLKLTGGKLSALGWRGADLKWVGLSWGLTLLGFFVAYGVVWALGIASFPNPKFVEKLASAMHLKWAPVPVIVLAQAAVAATV